MPAFVISCDGSGKHPSCTTAVPHCHCVCGLPMPLDAQQCELCVLEGTVPQDIDQKVWDGKTYPSWRNRRTRAKDPAAYIILGRAIGDRLDSRYYGRLKP